MSFFQPTRESITQRMLTVHYKKKRFLDDYLWVEALTGTLLKTSSHHELFLKEAQAQK